MKYKIVLVPFPFDDLTGVKIRPAICLTDRISGYNHIVIAFVTSKISKANEKSDFILKSTDRDFHITGLKSDSAIRLHRLITIPTKIIRRQLGELPTHYRKDIDRKLRALFDL